MIELCSKRILISGGSGFLGQYVVRRLRKHGCKDIIVPRKNQYDLTLETDVQRLYDEARPNIVIHLAGFIGGIAANLANPAIFLYRNLMMGTMMIEYSQRKGVEKFVGLGSVCEYPDTSPVPFQEHNLWNGCPHEITAPYGIAKRMLLLQGQVYRRQYGFNAIHLIPTNLYGPGDNFDLTTSHVIPAVIRKCLEAQEQNIHHIVCWGDGTPTREFLFVEDCAEAIFLATSQYNGYNPVNIGTGFEISINDLTILIAEMTGFSGEIIWDDSKPNGQLRRYLDTTRSYEYFGFRAKTPLREGLAHTINWYRNYIPSADFDADV